ncbi:Holliday junction resolvase RuvX [Alphaproteobacteria bacterium]|jgi:putative holliday junction resolvase|nr:Holliday junction resolvase RuvX [Alphaproteobacteria bacterium]MBT5799281.1 Holliday junction resolvase RuvX [Alphaproteobacteria bacterium]MDA9189942.1 Holliday junction resolvase RuvX [Alphaproteobacteria bacterium]MDC0394733.1 Holliday junction resolvase RuvX [Alphaproteobacteria bacterium]MDC0461417.1 Holliday junction resolvase RuvX [Alphaproteobacteria bacterium]
MTICNIDDLIAQINQGERLVGLDVGKKTIGVALGDPSHKIASPHRIIWRQKFSTDMADLFAEMEMLNATGLIIGWPLLMNGDSGPACDSVRDFTHALLRIKDLPVVFQDERLSTQAVERSMIAADLTRKKRHLRRDALAASWILQSAFDQYQQAQLNKNIKNLDE